MLLSHTYQHMQEKTTTSSLEDQKDKKRGDVLEHFQPSPVQVEGFYKSSGPKQFLIKNYLPWAKKKVWTPSSWEGNGDELDMSSRGNKRWHLDCPFFGCQKVNEREEDPRTPGTEYWIPRTRGIIQKQAQKRQEWWTFVPLFQSPVVAWFTPTYPMLIWWCDTCMQLLGLGNKFHEAFTA